MSLFGFFGRRRPIREAAELADFIDENAAFLVQKGIYEYSRARAAHYAKVLFAEREFQAAVEVARWQAYPLGLAMVGEMLEGVLRPHAGDDRLALQAASGGLVLSVFDRYEVPQALGRDAWQAARNDLSLRLDRIGTHPVKRVMDIPEPLAKLYFDCMPIHPKLRGRDFSTTRNYLRVSLCNIHDTLTKRMDAAAMAQTLLAAGRGAG